MRGGGGGGGGANHKTSILGISLKSLLLRKVCYSHQSAITVLVTNLGTDRRGQTMQTVVFRLKANLNPFAHQDLVLGVKVSSSFLAMQVINIGTDYHKPDNYSSSPRLQKKPPRAQCDAFSD